MKTQRTKHFLIMGTAILLISGGTFTTIAMQRDQMVSGVGDATSSDQSAADSQALQQATNNANSMCPGITENVETTSDNCSPITANGTTVYLCAVVVKAQCHIPGSH